MNKFNKGFIPLIAIMVIAAVVLVGGGVVYYYVTKTQPATQTQQNQQQNIQNQQLQQQTPQINIVQPTNQTAGWSAYTNNQYGFEIKYPKINSFLVLNKPEVISSGNINNDGCFTGNSNYPNPVTEKGTATINNVPFCISWTNDSAMGHSYPTYFYTTYKNGNYFTLVFQFNITACDNLKEGTNYNPCIDFFNNSANNSDKIAGNIISTFKFTK